MRNWFCWQYIIKAIDMIRNSSLHYRLFDNILYHLLRYTYILKRYLYWNSLIAKIKHLITPKFVIYFIDIFKILQKVNLQLQIGVLKSVKVKCIVAAFMEKHLFKWNLDRGEYSHFSILLQTLNNKRIYLFTVNINTMTSFRSSNI